MKEILQKALKKRKGSQKGSGKVTADGPNMLRSTPEHARELSIPQAPVQIEDVENWAS